MCYSYPLFSFQGSTRFCSGRKLFYQIFILLSSTFLNFFTFLFSALPISHQRELLYQIRFRLSMFFFQNIRCKSFRYFVFRVFSSGTVNYYTRFSKNVNTFFNFFHLYFQYVQITFFFHILPVITGIHFFLLKYTIIYFKKIQQKVLQQ